MRWSCRRSPPPTRSARTVSLPYSTTAEEGSPSSAVVCLVLTPHVSSCARCYPAVQLSVVALVKGPLPVQVNSRVPLCEMVSVTLLKYTLVRRVLQTSRLGDRTTLHTLGVGYRWRASDQSGGASARAMRAPRSRVGGWVWAELPIDEKSGGTVTQNRVGVVIAAALLVGLVGACGDGGKAPAGRPHPTTRPPAAPTASPAAAAAPGASITAPTPQEHLHASLLAARFTAGVLPVPFADAVPTMGRVDDYDREQNVVGVVEVPVRGPDVSNGIVYAVLVVAATRGDGAG